MNEYLSLCCDAPEINEPGFKTICSQCHHRTDFYLDAPIARNTDPETSHQAAKAITESGRRKSLAKAALECVQQYPGLTAGEVGDKTGLGYHKVWRRCSELKKPVYDKSGELVRPAMIYEGPSKPYEGTRQATLYPIQGQGILF